MGTLNNLVINMAKSKSLYGIDAEHTLSKETFRKEEEVEVELPIAEKCKKFLLDAGKNIGLTVFIFLGLTSEVVKDKWKP